MPPVAWPSGSFYQKVIQLDPKVVPWYLQGWSHVTWKTHKRVPYSFAVFASMVFFFDKKKTANLPLKTETTEAWSIYFRPSFYMAFTIGAPLYSAVKPMRRCTRGRFTRAMVATFRRHGAWFSRLRTLQLVRKGNKGIQWETGSSI